MSPTGHFVTTASVCVLSHALGGSGELTVGLFLGGFLIDVDHYFDYLVFEQQRSLNPIKFLNYYLECKLKRAILILHSYELMAMLSLLAAFTHSKVLIGYLLGATMHLALDIYFNGQHVLREPFHFYSFFYRQSKGFLASQMLDAPPEVVKVHPGIENMEDGAL
jgi:hypothetical protein